MDHDSIIKNTLKNYPTFNDQKSCSSSADELESDIEHLKDVLKDFKGCDECRKDHERLLGYLRELQAFRSTSL